MLLLLLACTTPEPSCPLWFSDLDGDGFGGSDGVLSCEPLSGRIDQDGDCDDRDGAIFPGAEDHPLDGLDQDCDGEDLCQNPRIVLSMDDVDCSLGMHTVGADAYSWPAGDCICALTGDLSLSPEEFALLQGGLTKVVGDVLMNFPLEGDGQGFKNLMEVEGTLTLHAGADYELPRLRRAPVLELSGEGGVTMRMPVLAEADALYLNGGVSLELEQLFSLEELVMLGAPEDTLLASRLNSVETLELQGGRLDAPDLTWGNEATLNTTVDLPQFSFLDTLNVDSDAHATLPSLQTVELIELAGELSAATLTRLPRLKARAGGQAELPALKTVDFLFVEGTVLELPSLERSDYIEVEQGGLLIVPSLESINHMHVNLAAVTAAHLTEATFLNLDEQAPGAFEAPKLATVGTLLLLSDTDFPALSVADSITSSGATEMPQLRELGSIQVNAPLSAPMLTTATKVTLYGQGHSLPALRSVGSLRTQDCLAFGALVRIDSWITSSCDLDLRGLNTFPGPLHLDPVGVATRFTLPDPLPTALWLDGSNYGSLEQDVVQGALSIQVRASAPAEDFVVREIQGQLYMNLDKATGLGSLDQIEEVGGDVSYCAPLIPDAEIQSWLTALSVGGEVVNRCP